LPRKLIAGNATTVAIQIGQLSTYY